MPEVGDLFFAVLSAELDQLKRLFKKLIKIMVLDEVEVHQLCLARFQNAVDYLLQLVMQNVVVWEIGELPKEHFFELCPCDYLQLVICDEVFH